MDEQLTLHELHRLEAERKLRTIPQQVLETAWVRDAQIEAVIDAVLAVTLAGDAKALAHARHVGEWCARIAAALPLGPDPVFARRVGVLADVDPAALERIDELKQFSSHVREYQDAAMGDCKSQRTMSIIVAVAEEFDARITAHGDNCTPSPTAVLRSMVDSATATSRTIVDTLCNVAHFSESTRVA